MPNATDPCAALRDAHTTEVASMVAFQNQVSAIINDPLAFQHHGTYHALESLADRIVAAPTHHPGKTLLAAMALRYAARHTYPHAQVTRAVIRELFQYAARP